MQADRIRQLLRLLSKLDSRIGEAKPNVSGSCSA
jgi:hypothetical protein